MLYNPKNWTLKAIKEQIEYANTDPRRRQELLDSRMISADHSAMANLPTQAIQREFTSNTFNKRMLFDDEVL